MRNSLRIARLLAAVASVLAGCVGGAGSTTIDRGGQPAWLVGTWREADVIETERTPKKLELRADGTCTQDYRTCTWSAEGRSLYIDGRFHEIDTTPGCRFMRANEVGGYTMLTFDRGSISEACPTPIEELTENEECLVGSFARTNNSGDSAESLTFSADRTFVRSQLDSYGSGYVIDRWQKFSGYWLYDHAEKTIDVYRPGSETAAAHPIKLTIDSFGNSYLLYDGELYKRRSGDKACRLR
jgi:hypothetical protein